MNSLAEKTAYHGAASIGGAPQEQPALHTVIQRLGNLAVRLGDNNARNRAFIERTVGGKPEPVSDRRNGETAANARPAALELSALIDVLDQRMAEAEYLARENERLG